MVFLGHGQARPPDVVDRREVSKKLVLQISCGCGVRVFEILQHTMLSAPQTGLALARQAHAKHQRETGCGKELV